MKSKTSKLASTTLTVVRTKFGKKKSVEQDVEDSTIDVREFQTDAARVTVGAERTVNLGNYESAKMRVELSIPCYVEEITAVQKTAITQVQSRLDAALTAWHAELSKGKK